MDREVLLEPRNDFLEHVELSSERMQEDEVRAHPGLDAADSYAAEIRIVDGNSGGPEQYFWPLWQPVSRTCSWHHPSAGLAATAIRCTPRGVGASATGRSSLQPPSMMSSNAATVSILSDRTRKKAGHPPQTPRTEQSGVLTICSRRPAIR